MVWVGKTWAGSVCWALVHHSRAAPTVAVAVIGGSCRTVRKTIGVDLLTLDNAHSYPVTAITVNAVGTAALAGPDQRSSTSGPSLHRPTQIIMQAPAAFSSSSSTLSRWSGTPARTPVSQVPHVPSRQENSTLTPPSFWASLLLCPPSPRDR